MVIRIAVEVLASSKAKATCRSWLDTCGRKMKDSNKRPFHVGARQLERKQSIMSTTSDYGLQLQLARVEREMEAMKDAQQSVLNLNCCSLREIPEQLVCCEYCRNTLQKLYLKRNCIATLV